MSGTGYLADEISVIIPAYNEEKNLPQVIEGALEILKPNFGNFEVVVLNDGSTDRTGSIIDDFAAREPAVRPVHRDKNKGIAASINELHDLAGFKRVVLLAGDGQWDPNEIIPLVEKMNRTGCDIVVSRRISKQYSLFRRFISWFFNFCVKALFRFDPFDIGSIKLIRKEVIDTVRLETCSAFSEAERLIKAHWSGKRIECVDTVHLQRKHGRASGAVPREIRRAVIDLLWFLMKYGLTPSRYIQSSPSAAQNKPH